MKVDQMAKLLLENGASLSDVRRFGRKEFAKTIRETGSVLVNQEKKRILTPTMKGRFARAYSWLYDGIGAMAHYAYQEARYDEIKNKIQTVTKGKEIEYWDKEDGGDTGLSIDMAVEFLTHDICYMSFVFGYLFGEAFQVPNNEDLAVIRSLIKEKELFPYVPRIPLEKSAWQKPKGMIEEVTTRG